MKTIIDFFSKYWNMILGFVGAFILLLSNIVKPPSIELYFSESQIDLTMLAKIVAAGLTILILILFEKYKSKLYAKRWIWMALLFFLLAGGLLYWYNVEVNKRSAYNSIAERRQVIGSTYLNQVKPFVDSLERIRRNDPIDPAYLLERTNSPLDIWVRKEVESNSRYLSILYLATILTFFYFLLFALQAFYSSTRKR